MGSPKSDRYDSYSMPLVFKNEDRTVKVLKEILSKCKTHLSGKDFGKCLYENPTAERRPFTQSYGTTVKDLYEYLRRRHRS